MRKLLLILPLITGFAVASDDGKQLFESKCSSCHTMGMPQDRAKMVAPPAMGITRHLKMAHPKREDFQKFLADYVINPSAEKALCRKQTVKKFGVMPSQKGNVTADELKNIADFLFDNYAKDGQGCQRRGMHRGNGQGMHQGMGMHQGQGRGGM